MTWIEEIETLQKQREYITLVRKRKNYASIYCKSKMVLLNVRSCYHTSIQVQGRCSVKVRFTQKMLVKLSHCHSSEPFFAPGLLFPVNGMNISDKMSIFWFFCINQINLLKLIQICNHGIIINFMALQAM